MTHPIEPVFDERSRILILGSFPSVKSRETGFYYGHPQNRFWRVLASVFNDGVPVSISEKKDFLLLHRVALWDVIASCEIEGSSDASIKNAVATDLSLIFSKAKIESVFTNGNTASKLFEKFHPDISHASLPSTSPANAAWSLDRLTAAWRIILL